MMVFRENMPDAGAGPATRFWHFIKYAVVALSLFSFVFIISHSGYGLSAKNIVSVTNLFIPTSGSSDQSGTSNHSRSGRLVLKGGMQKLRGILSPDGKNNKVNDISTRFSSNSTATPVYSPTSEFTASNSSKLTSSPRLPTRTSRNTPSRSMTTTKAIPTTTSVGRHTAVPETRGDLFVTFSGGFKDGRGLGNQMFDIAAAVYVATLSGRTFIMENVSFVQMVDNAFDFTAVSRIANPCPCFHFSERGGLMYDPRVEELGQPGHPSAEKRTIMVGGFFQSWRYTRNVEKKLRKLFTFKSNVREYAEKFLVKNYPPGWTNAFVRVAIHVRRGDNLIPDKQKFGYTIPKQSYFQNAMRYFITNYGRTQFIAVSQDKDWTRTNVIPPGDIPPADINVTYAFDNNAQQDMAIMASCDHMIMSTGTFGWWAGFLAKGLTLYYSDWPRNGSVLFGGFRRQDFFPPSWKGMDNERFAR